LHPRALPIAGHPPVPTRDGRFQDAPERDDPGVRHQHVDPPVALDRGLDHPPRILRHRNIPDHRLHFRTGATKFVGESDERCFLDVGDDEASAFLGKTRRGRPSDTEGGTGDHAGFGWETTGHRPPPRYAIARSTSRVPAATAARKAAIVSRTPSPNGRQLAGPNASSTGFPSTSSGTGIGTVS